jgi:hypothetical protein
MFVSFVPVIYPSSGLTGAFSYPGPNMAGYSSFSTENRVHAREGDQVVLNQSKFQATNEKGELISREELGDGSVHWTVNGNEVTDTKKIGELKRFYEQERLRQKNQSKAMKQWRQQFDEQMKQFEERMNALFSPWFNPVKPSLFDISSHDWLKGF